MKAENMPYYCGPRIPIEHCSSETSTDEDNVDVHPNNLMTTIVTQGDIGHTSLCIRPFQVGTFVSMPPRTSCTNYNADLPALSYRATTFSWAVYEFNSGHFVTTIEKRNLPFHIVLACNPFDYGRALFNECLVPHPYSTTFAARETRDTSMAI